MKGCSKKEFKITRRLLKEFNKCYESEEFEFYFDEDGRFGEKNIGYIKFTVKTGIYKDQQHLLSIKFLYGSNEVYKFPKNPPKVLFLTPIYHANISIGGSICLDVIKDQWTPMLDIIAVFNSIVILLEVPNIDSPFNSDASKDYKKMPLEEYKKKCQKYYELNLSEANKKALAGDYWK